MLSFIFPNGIAFKAVIWQVVAVVADYFLLEERDNFFVNALLIPNLCVDRDTRFN